MGICHSEIISFWHWVVPRITRVDIWSLPPSLVQIYVYMFYLEIKLCHKNWLSLVCQLSDSAKYLVRNTHWREIICSVQFSSVNYSDKVVCLELEIPDIDCLKNVKKYLELRFGFLRFLRLNLIGRWVGWWVV